MRKMSGVCSLVLYTKSRFTMQMHLEFPDSGNDKAILLFMHPHELVKD